MTKILYCFATALILCTQTAFAQMADGQYTFSNDEVSLELNITGEGWTIATATLTNKTSKKTLTGKGEYRHANNFEWYDFQTTECNYSFEIPTNNLVLEQFDCKNGKPASKFTLTKKVTDWTGTYHNSDSGVLIITNFKDGVSFNYQMTYGGPSSCGGFELSGLARIISITKAEAGEDKENPITLELNGDKIVFMPSCCDGTIGMECQRYFDSEFVKK